MITLLSHVNASRPGSVYYTRPLSNGSIRHQVSARIATVEQLIEFIMNHLFLSTAFAAVLGLLVFNLSQGSGGNAVSPQELIRMINHERAIPVDVRKEADYTEGHIIDAVNVPLTNLSERMKELEKHKGRPVVLCCAAGTTTAPAVKTLQKAGFEKVYSLKGGISAWRQENLPLTN